MMQEPLIGAMHRERWDLFRSALQLSCFSTCVGDPRTWGPRKAAVRASMVVTIHHCDAQAGLAGASPP